MVSKDTNEFEGLRTFPRDPNELRHHNSCLNYTLQKRYHIAPEMVKLALEPQNTEEFNRYYRQQVMRIIGHFNAVTRKQLKVRVDPRLPKGMQLIRQGTVVVPIGESKTDKKKTEWHATVPTPSAGKVNSLLEDINSKSDPFWSERVTQTNTGTKMMQAEGEHTPKTASSALASMIKGAHNVTDGMATVSSDDRSTCDRSSMKKSCRKIVFGTPPEFKGFTVPLEGSPVDSMMSKSPLLF